MAMLVDPPAAIVPSVQVTVPPECAQAGVALTNVTPAGSGSVSIAPTLSFGPRLPTSIVQVNGTPGVNDAGPLLATARSAVRRDVVACTVALFAASVSGSSAVTLAALNVVPETPDAIVSARIE